MLLTVPEAAGKLRISSKQLRRMIDAGELPTVRLGTSARADRILQEHLDELIEKKTKRHTPWNPTIEQESGISTSPSPSPDDALESRLRSATGRARAPRPARRRAG